AARAATSAAVGTGGQKGGVRAPPRAPRGPGAVFNKFPNFVWHNPAPPAGQIPPGVPEKLKNGRGGPPRGGTAPAGGRRAARRGRGPGPGGGGPAAPGGGRPPRVPAGSHRAGQAPGPSVEVPDRRWPPPPLSRPSSCP